ncbi:MAG: FeoB-associated Cys-rich membrane protein [Tissierellia bacterium]|nr:FeoB-associated Cys-rich membrane protein [Tissierellia bacterium]
MTIGNLITMLLLLLVLVVVIRGIVRSNDGGYGCSGCGACHTSNPDIKHCQNKSK